MLRVEEINTATIKLKIKFQSIPVLDKEALLNELVTLTNFPPTLSWCYRPYMQLMERKFLTLQ
jgi:hypothetical protein